MLIVALFALVLFDIASSSCTLHGFPEDPSLLPSPIYTSFRQSLTQTGLNKIVNYALSDFISDRFAEIMIGDITGSIDTSFAGVVNYSLSDIQLNNWYINEFGVTLTEGDVDNIIFMNDCGLTLDFKWQYEETVWPYIGDSGYGEATISGMSGNAYISLALSQECSGHLSANCTHMDLDLGDLDIDLSGGASWLYSLIIDILIDTLEDALNQQLAELMAPAITLAVTDLLATFDSFLPSPADDSDGSGLDYRMLTDPRFHDSAMVVDMHGQDYGPETWEGKALNRSWVYPETVTMPDLITEDDVQFFIGRPTFDSWLYVHHDVMDSFKGTVDYQDVPATYQPFLTTGVLSAYAPGLANYPPDTPLSLRVTSTATPSTTIYPAAAYVAWGGSVEVGTGLSFTDSSDVLFTLDAQLGTSGGLDWWTEHTALWGENFTLFFLDTEYYNSSLSLGSSEVGDVEVDGDLSMLFTLLASEAVCPWIQNLWSVNAMSTPNTDFLNLDDFYAVYYDDYILWATSVL